MWKFPVHVFNGGKVHGSILANRRMRTAACLDVILRGAFTLSKLALFVIGSPAQFRNRFRSLSNVNRSGSQNASKNAAAAAEKTEYSNGVLMPRPVTMPVANDKRRRPERTEAIRLGVRIPTVKARLFRGRQKASALF